MNINKNLKAALIGCGKFGIGSHKNKFNHLSVINKHKLINLVALCDLHKVNLKNLIKIKFYHNIKKLFKDNKINLAIITTDNLSHFKILNICIKEKIKFIICEKPLAITYKDYLNPPLKIAFSSSWTVEPLSGVGARERPRVTGNPVVLNP